MALPADGFVDVADPAGFVTEHLPEAYEATYREGAGGALVVENPVEHEALVLEDDETEGSLGADSAGNVVLELTLRRVDTYGGVLIDSFVGVAAAEPKGPYGFFFGRAGTAELLKFGEVHQDDGAQILARIVPRQIGLAGLGGEVLYRNVYLTIETDSLAQVTVTPILDGREITSQTKSVLVEAADGAQEYEIPLTETYQVGGIEKIRQGIRGTAFTVKIEVFDLGIGGPQVAIGNVEVEAEPVTERHPDVPFSELPVLEEDPPYLPSFYFGLGGALGKFGEVRTDLGQAIRGRVESNHVAPAGVGGEGIFRNLYLYIARGSGPALDLELTPIVDGEDRPTRSLTVEAAVVPRRDVLEVPLLEAHEVEGREAFRYAPRGTFFGARLETVGALPTGDVVFEGATLEFDPTRESEEAVE